MWLYFFIYLVTYTILLILFSYYMSILLTLLFIQYKLVIFIIFFIFIFLFYIYYRVDFWFYVLIYYKLELYQERWEKYSNNFYLLIEEIHDLMLKLLIYHGDFISLFFLYHRYVWGAIKNFVNIIFFYFNEVFCSFDKNPRILYALHLAVGQFCRNIFYWTILDRFTVEKKLVYPHLRKKEREEKEYKNKQKKEKLKDFEFNSDKSYEELKKRWEQKKIIWRQKKIIWKDWNKQKKIFKDIREIIIKIQSKKEQNQNTESNRVYPVFFLYYNNIINFLIEQNIFFLNIFFKLSFFFFYNFFKNIIICFILSLIFLLYTLIFFQLPVLQYFSIWIVLGFLFLWLISGFNFFLKKYKYGKFTSSIQRFWKRTNLIFWFIEFFLFTLFFYYYLNSSKEPNFMFDFFYLNNQYNFNIYSIYYNLFFFCLIIFCMFLLLLTINFLNFNQTLVHILILSSLIYTLFLYETYQFFYLITNFKEVFWDLDVDLEKEDEDSLWSLEEEEISDRYMRVKFYYFSLCLLAKYWHFFFIAVSWYFFLLKSIENKKFTYNFLSYNFQNFIILFFLNLLCFIDLFKWLSHRFLEIPYFWFFVNYDTFFIINLYYECFNIIVNIFSVNKNYFNLNFIFILKNIWTVDSLFTIKNF